MASDQRCCRSGGGVAAQHEEHIDAEEAAGQRRELLMEGQNREDRKRAQAIEAGRAGLDLPGDLVIPARRMLCQH